jgi:hypothetical protein
VRATANGLQLWNYDEKSGQPVKGVQPNDMVASVSDDGQWLYVGRVTSLPTLKVFHVNVRTGVAETVTDLAFNDLAGLTSLRGMIITPDGKTIVLCYVRHLSELYLMQRGARSSFF